MPKQVLVNMVFLLPTKVMQDSERGSSTCLPKGVPIKVRSKYGVDLNKELHAHTQPGACIKTNSVSNSLCAMVYKI